MERTKKIEKEDDGTIRWKKTGGGSFRLPNRIIKPGQTFRARPDQIPIAFRDTVIALDPIPEGAFQGKPKEPEVKIPGVIPEYTVKQRGKAPWYDIVNKAGKPLNEKALKKDEAEQLIKDLAQ